ncbi:MAG: hypothetical protein HWN66_00815 [Candidatus Helarchaeota archaeon]|nr:hypothetical protein [Candidatus Helarchaeota archaeon]
MDEKTLRILDERTYFVGDRVILSQIMMFLIAGAFTCLIEIVGLSEITIRYLWWLFCIVLPVGALVILLVYKESLYFDHHWHTSFALLGLMMWVPLVSYLGVLFDNLFESLYGAAWLSLFVSLILGTGYGLAKILRIRRNSINTLKVGAIFSVILLLFTIIFGSIMYSSALEANGLGLFDIKEIHQCQSCISSVYIIIGGIGIVVSMALFSYMFHCLLDPAGIDVEEDPPNELYLKVMRVSWILCFISWFLLLVLFPPIAGGGKGKKGGRVRARTTRRSVYLTTRHYGKKKKRYPPEEVEDEWKEHELGK